MVRTEIRKPGESTVAIDFAMRLSKGQWKVYYLNCRYQLISNYRINFANEINARDLDVWIAKLEKKLPVGINLIILMAKSC